MSRKQEYRVISDEGLTGAILASSRFLDDSETRILRLDDGREYMVPAAALEPQRDGTFRLLMTGAELERRSAARTIEEVAPNERTIPVIEEQLRVDSRRVPTGKVLIHKSVERQEAVVDEPLLSENFDIERVPINRVLDEPVEPYHEGDTFVLPVLEEVLVVEKRLVLREEVRITRRKTAKRDPRRVELRREHIDVERVGGR